MLNANRLRALFDYDPERGVLIGRTGRRAGRVAAGSDTGDGHRNLTVDGRSYLLHRLIWLHVQGEWPDGRLDHRDCDPNNNRIANLRKATASQNKANGHRYRNNRSGYKGVHYRGQDRWRASIRKDGSLISLGSFATPELAYAAYCRAALDLHGEFARLA